MSPAAHSDSNVMGSLTQKITQILTAPDTVNPGAAPSAGRSAGQGAGTGSGGGRAGEAPLFVSFCAPGVPIGRNDLDFGDMAAKAEVDANAAFSQMVNNIPSSQGFWSLTGRKIWDVYEDAITQVALPATTLTPQQQSELEQALALLTRPVTKTDPFTGARTQVVQDSPQVAAYRRHQTAYIAALATCNGMEIQANSPGASNTLVQDWARNGAAYEAQVTGAYASWVTDGCKSEVEEALSVVGRLAGLGSTTLYETLRAGFAASRMTDSLGQTFHPTYVYPTDPLVSLMTALKASWTSFEFNLQDLQTFQPDARTSSGGNAGDGWGLWSASAWGEYGTGQATFGCDTTGLIVQADLIQVPLTRSWLRPEIFSSRGWRWSPTAGFGPVSDGESPPVGLMPLLPTAIVIAQNVMINLDMTNQQNASSWSAISGKASIGWGPFSIQGNQSHRGASPESHFTQSNGGIAVPGPQIIAFVCEVLPRSPDPDPSLQWPGW